MSTDQLRAGLSGNTQSAKQNANPVAVFNSFMDRLKPQLALALPKHLNPERMARLAVTAFSKNLALQKCTQQSIAASIMTAAQLGLEPEVNGQGYLIPYGQTCTFVPGWRGIVDLVSRSGRATVWTGAVRAGDQFDYALGAKPFCIHKPGDEDDDAPFTHVYAIGQVRGAEMPVIEVWTRGKVERHLKQYNKVGQRHYARSNEGNYEMYARKVALLQVLKYMPQSVEMQNAVALANETETGRGAVLDGDGLVSVINEEPAPSGPAAEDASPHVDPSTGEIDAPAPSYAQLAASIQAAMSRKDAEDILSLGKHLPQKQQQELAALINLRTKD